MTVTHVPGLFCNLCPWTVPGAPENNQMQLTSGGRLGEARTDGERWRCRVFVEAPLAADLCSTDVGEHATGPI